MDNRHVFDLIAESWYRVHHWTRFRAELDEVARRWRGGRLLNVGCGHGPDFLPFAGSFDLYGVDFSPAMIRMAQRFAAKNGFVANLVVADVRWLPFAEASFDCAIAVATYHHIKGEDGRQQALAELRRVLKPGGEALITVWNRGQTQFWGKGKEVAVPWRFKGQTLERYYYLYSHGEFRKALEKAGFGVSRIGPEASFHGPLQRLSRNIVALVRK